MYFVPGSPSTVDDFDSSAECGCRILPGFGFKSLLGLPDRIDLSLYGHTHGGQVTLDFVDARLSPAHVLTDYARGLFPQRDSQLYVNCGIGTIGFPIRLGAQPEITVIELTRQA